LIEKVYFAAIKFINSCYIIFHLPIQDFWIKVNKLRTKHNKLANFKLLKECFNRLNCFFRGNYMYRMEVLFFILVFGFSAFSQPTTLSGKVTNKSGKALAGAIVTIQGQHIADTTSSEGLYSISMNVAANPAPFLPSTEEISLNKGNISISLTKQAPVRIEIFSMRGNLLERVENSSASAGKYQFDLTAHPLAATMMVIRAAIGNRVSSFRYLPLNNGKLTIASSIIASSSFIGGGLAKLQATADSLKVSASNYLRTSVPITSYSGTKNITLDTLPFARFSFFVTSLEALQELSGSEKGFGGNLSFGKTGPGAGIRGADSICQCIAEKSMLGSKIKVWRAFLSVVSGPDGKQINAIDRIGDGPWYDRRGRLVAPNVAALFQNRPVGCDTLIKNDLPNENGIPNHQPDPGLPQVDNHLTVTGSDSLGRLFSSTSTCADWTSTTADSKPRVGFSWTRLMGGFGGGGMFGKKKAVWPFDTTGMGGGGFMMMNMENWMSAWDQAGCEAGVDLEESTGPGVPGVKTIGSGGGYGGFYCFGLNP
jgi:hypothetical protein